jgi:hypothetical protein
VVGLGVWESGRLGVEALEGLYNNKIMLKSRKGSYVYNNKLNSEGVLGDN